MIHLASGIAIRDGALLLVASRYPNQPRPLWNLPGGRQQRGELLTDTVVREFLEETSLRARVVELAYVSESYDREKHFLNATFVVEADGEPHLETEGEDHVVAVQWVPLASVRERLEVAVVRDPLIAYLQGVLERRYAGYYSAGITIEWPDGSA
ncbi:MAG TPA: NUDIX domain-containing protein [Candidatus Cybelea sp.]|jgi:ADP-ribose pyrophosphatase YjhB (NUDIX family)|nr:NUDIX domain-containing protein [Candidatus Cybelea sp.]